ncbi:MAG: hypothetical protein ACREBW_07690 [Candidatus Micrarchaeaceae archaeon]
MARALSGIDTADLAPRPRDMVSSLKMQVIDLRLETRDYEYAENRQDQQTHAKAVYAYAGAVREGILAVSESGVFSVVEVVEFSTLLDNLIECLI